MASTEDLSVLFGHKKLNICNKLSIHDRMSIQSNSPTLFRVYLVILFLLFAKKAFTPLVMFFVNGIRNYASTKLQNIVKLQVNTASSFHWYGSPTVPIGSFMYVINQALDVIYKE